MKARRGIKAGEDLMSVPESIVLRVIGEAPVFPMGMDAIVSKQVVTHSGRTPPNISNFSNRNNKAT